jgi:hypothetical protein
MSIDLEARRSVMKELSVAVTKRMPVILGQRRRHRRIPEAWVAGKIRRRPVCNVAPCGLYAIMMPLLRSLRVSRRWRWGIICRRLWMRTSRNRKSK